MVNFVVADGSKSKILIIGSTGYIGKYLVETSVKFGHPTLVMVREHSLASDPEKAETIKNFKKLGVSVNFGDVNDHESLLRSIKQVDVVFSVMGHDPDKQLADQINIVFAIKEAGNIKRFFPSEYGFDVDRLNILEPARGTLGIKSRIRQAIRDAGIPFTFVSSNLCATYFLSRLGQVEETETPTDKVTIVGDGDAKIVFVSEDDIATYAIKAVDDPRTLNKVLYVRPPKNICTINKLVSLWEQKSNTILERNYVPEEGVVKKIKESPHPFPFFYAIAHAGFIQGVMMNFEIDPTIGIEASELYPDVKYTTVDECLNKFV